MYVRATAEELRTSCLIRDGEKREECRKGLAVQWDKGSRWWKKGTDCLESGGRGDGRGDLLQNRHVPPWQIRHLQAPQEPQQCLRFHTQPWRCICIALHEFLNLPQYINDRFICHKSKGTSEFCYGYKRGQNELYLSIFIIFSNSITCEHVKGRFTLTWVWNSNDPVSNFHQCVS